MANYQLFANGKNVVLPGRIIEYIEHGKFICAAVMDDAGKRVRLLNQHGREVNLPTARIVHCSTQALPNNSSRQEILTILQDTDQLRQTLELPIPLEEVWQLAIDSSENSFSSRFLTELCFGELATDDHEAAFLREIFLDHIFFKYKEGQIIAHSQEVVEQLQTAREAKNRQEMLLSQGAANLARLYQGQEIEDWPDKEHCLRLIREYYLFDKEAEEFETTRQLLKKAGLTTPHAPYHLMVKTGEWRASENISLLRQRLPIEFSKECMEQVASLKEPDGDLLCQEGRHDFRQLPLLTIDGKGTRDFDDAVHIEKKDDHFLLGIHISDVGRYIKPGTPLYECAMERTTSIYFADQTIPMLPKDLSENIFSLVKDKDRAAISFLVDISKDGEILSKKIVKSVVNVKRQLSYTHADVLYKDDQDLQDLVMLSSKLRQRRINAGAMIIPIPDVIINIEDDEVVSIKTSSVETRMRVLIAELMVLANSIGAEFLAVRQEAGLFRSQGPPQKRLFDSPQDDLYTNFRQRRHLARGQLTTSPKRHSGVGVEQYTTLTSPIRRSLDLIMQLQLTAVIERAGAIYTTKDLNSLAADMAVTTSKVNLVRQNRHRFWILKYLEGKQGQKMPAFILARNHQKVKVVLVDLLLEGELPPNQGTHAMPGDNIMVKIGTARPLDNILRLEWG